MSEAATDIGDRLAAVRARIAAAAAAAGRPAGSVTLVAVGKGQSAERLRAALAAGQRVFALNRVQEAKAKWPELKAEYSAAELRLIGPLQTNKAKDAVALFNAIETVDRPRLAEVLATAMASGRRPACLVQVNTGEEPQKGGVAPAAADELVALCRRLALPLAGLMCLPPADEPPAPHFALLARIAERHGLGVLSMGMSADFETAIRLGATHVRIGTAIFGPREA